MSKLVVLGSVNIDHVVKVPRFPQPGETLSGHSYRTIPGGKGANQAVAAARLGADVSFIACVGDDQHGMDMKAAFAQDGMNIQAVEVIEDTPTGIAIIYVAESGENCICLSPEANDALSADIATQYASLIGNADILLLQLETPLEGITKAVEIAKAARTAVVLNPAPARPLPDELLAQVTMITPNETEAEILTGVKVTDDASAQQAADVFHAKGIQDVFITLGSKGVWISTPNTQKRIEGYKVKAVDTTAAGDTFNAGLMVALMEKMSLDEGVMFAHAAAAVTVSGEGAQTSIPTREQVEAFRKKQG